MSKCIIVFAAESKMPRRMIVLNKKDFVGGDVLEEGEDMIYVNNGKDDHSIEFMVREIAKFHGVEESEVTWPRCACINPMTGMVEQMIAADPALDSLPPYTLVLAPEYVSIGWKRSGDEFLHRVVAVDGGGVVRSESWRPHGHLPLVDENGLREIDGHSELEIGAVIPQEVSVDYPTSGAEQL